MNIVKDPTLPTNIAIITTILPIDVKLGVPPILEPTVAIADIISNPHSLKYPMLLSNNPSSSVLK